MRGSLVLVYLLPVILTLVACGGGGGGSGGGGGGGGAATAPVISAFAASPAQVQPGQSASLTWSVQGATSLSISAGVGSVDGLSSRTVSPGATTTYVLTATNGSGSVTASTTVTVLGAAYPPGLAADTLQVGGVTREFRVYTPSNLTSAPKALVFVLHGGGGAGLNIANPGAHPLSVFRDVADREGFLVVYPGGLPAQDGSPGWNDCRSDNQTSSGADDLGFLNALIERLRAQYGMPVTRVFMAGGSNGAQMTFSYAIAGAGNVGAIATSNGNLPQNPKSGACSASPPRRLPVLMAHGTADPAMPFAGGCVANLGGGCARGRVISAEATRDVWLSANGLAAISPVQTVFDTNKTDPGPANRFAYAGGSPVEWWRMDGGGHPVSSRTVLVASSPDSGPQNRDVEFAEIAWNFFNASLQAPIAVAPSAAAVQSAREYNFSVGGQTFLVMYDGQVLDEAYANGGSAGRAQLLASATKGFTGMVGAIGASEGLYALDEVVSQRALTEWKTSPLKSQITFRHLLTMSSGLKELNDLSGWNEYLSAEAINTPGDVFIYSGDPNIYGLALERRLGGESVTTYFDRKLFQPLSITSLRWGTNFADGHPQLSGGAYITARDWAKFGEFVRLTIEGRWTGPQILSRAEFDQVLRGSRAHPAYGFYWWLKEPVPSSLAATIDANNKNQFTRQIKPIIEEPSVPGDFVMLAGAYGQRLYVIPSRKLTVIRHAPANTPEEQFKDAEFLRRLLKP